MNRKLSRSVWGEGVGKVLTTVTRWPPMPLSARFGGELSETYRRKAIRRRGFTLLGNWAHRKQKGRSNNQDRVDIVSKARAKVRVKSREDINYKCEIWKSTFSKL